MNKEIVELKKSRSYTQLLTFIEINQNSFNHVNWSSCRSTLGAISFRDAEHVKRSPVFQAFLRETVTKMEMGKAFFDAQSCANIIHAVAKLSLSGSDVDSLFFEIVRNSKWLVENGTHPNIANIAWACAKLNYPSPLLFAEVERNSKWLAKNGKPQEVANTVWACATLNCSSPLLFAEVERHGKRLVETGNAQDVSNILWSFAVVGDSHLLGKMFEELWNEAMNKKMEFQSEALFQLYQVQL